MQINPVSCAVPLGKTGWHTLDHESPHLRYHGEPRRLSTPDGIPEAQTPRQPAHGGGGDRRGGEEVRAAAHQAPEAQIPQEPVWGGGGDGRGGEGVRAVVHQAPEAQTPREPA